MSANSCVCSFYPSATHETHPGTARDLQNLRHDLKKGITGLQVSDMVQVEPNKPHQDRFHPHAEVQINVLQFPLLGELQKVYCVYQLGNNTGMKKAQIKCLLFRVLFYMLMMITCL